MNSKLLDNCTLFDGVDTRENCSLLIEGETVAKIEEAGSIPPSDSEWTDLGGHRLLPGFIDVQVNGGGGILFNDDLSVSGIRKIADTHVRFGTTSLLPTLISDEYDVIRAAILAVRQAVDEGVQGIAGIHIEGPFLNEVRKGAHDARTFRRLDDEGVELLTGLGPDLVTLVTLAPERNCLKRVRALRDAGLVVFAGHTAATYDQCRAAEAAGVSGYTHLFNAMTPLESREPGIVGAAIDSPAACFSIIADFHHVHPVSASIAIRAKFPGGAILVTDAMPTVGGADRSFELHGEQIELKNGALRNAVGSLAGSNLTMIDAVRNAARFEGVDWQESVRMASRYPGAAIGKSDSIGTIDVGKPADLVEVDNDFDIRRVWRRGSLVHMTAH